MKINSADVFAWIAMVALSSLILLATIGYVLNLVAIARWVEGTGMLVLRVIGVFVAPLGAILGWV